MRTWSVKKLCQKLSHCKQRIGTLHFLWYFVSEFVPFCVGYNIIDFDFKYPHNAAQNKVYQSANYKFMIFAL